MNKKYIVLWVKGGRIGSVVNTTENLLKLKTELLLSPIQRDITGTEHYNVLSVRKEK